MALGTAWIGKDESNNEDGIHNDRKNNWWKSRYLLGVFCDNGKGEEQPIVTGKREGGMLEASTIAWELQPSPILPIKSKSALQSNGGYRQAEDFFLLRP